MSADGNVPRSIDAARLESESDVDVMEPCVIRNGHLAWPEYKWYEDERLSDEVTKRTKFRVTIMVAVSRVAYDDRRTMHAYPYEARYVINGTSCVHSGCLPINADTASEIFQIVSDSVRNDIMVNIQMMTDPSDYEGGGQRIEKDDDGDDRDVPAGRPDPGTPAPERMPIGLESHS